MSDIKLFNQRQIRSAWNEEEEQWYFSVQDVVEILTDSADVKQYIKRLRQRDAVLNFNWGTICTPVEMIAAEEMSKNEKPDTFEDNRKVARRGGRVAGNARKETEKELGRNVVSSQNFLENTGIDTEDAEDEKKSIEP